MSMRGMTWRFRCISCRAGTTGARTSTAAASRTAAACCASSSRRPRKPSATPARSRCALRSTSCWGRTASPARARGDVIAMLAELPDLWDVNVSEWVNDSPTSRFAEEGYQERYIETVKRLTTKPVVGVGRYTSPDRMVQLVRNGVLDFIGAARPSIADPFLPRKIEEGRLEDIRECIGCNICVASDNLRAPMRCTQNPTSGEEWRR